VDNVTISPSLLPASPSNFTVTATAYNKVNLSWNDNSNNESAFEVTRSTSQLGVYTTIGAAPANATSFIDSVGLDPLTKYWYKLKAVNQYGASAVLSQLDAAWSFDNNYNDASGNNRNLSGNASPVFSTDRKEGSHSISLNGSTQYINVPFSVNNVFPNNAYSAK